MVFANSKKYFKNYKTILLMLAMPIAVASLVCFLDNNSQKDSYVKVAIINLDKGKYGNELIKALGVNDVFENKEKAILQLKEENYAAVYEIPKGFSEDVGKEIKPIINSYKIEKGNKTEVFEISLEKCINKILQTNILKKNHIIRNEKELNNNIVNVDYVYSKGTLNKSNSFPVITIVFLMFISASGYSADLLSLRKSRILERLTSTSNKGYAVVGSIYASMFIVQVSLYLLSSVIIQIVFKYKFYDFTIMLLNIVFMSLISISMAILCVRIFKEAAISSFVISLIGMLMFFIYTFDEISPKENYILIVLKKFTPFYWIGDSLQKSVIFPNALILILMALVLLTAGSIRYSNFAKEE